ncbi:hypothetical protein RGAI101_1690 [Roseobacter sp. GAI101]|nr:hypothetical protein RGAI101_1690 [Roseobacter sp. GAI101]
MYASIRGHLTVSDRLFPILSVSYCVLLKGSDRVRKPCAALLEKWGMLRGNEIRPAP